MSRKAPSRASSRSIDISRRGAKGIEQVASDDGPEAPPTSVVKEADPELERLLAEEEEIERRTRQHHEAPHFRGDED